MSTVKNITLEYEEKVRDEEVLHGSKTSINWSTHHMNDRTEDNSAALEPVPAGSSQDGDLLESFVVEDRDGVGQEGRRPVSATRRVCRQLCRRNMMTFTLASACAFLTQVTVAVFMMTQVSTVVFLLTSWRIESPPPNPPGPSSPLYVTGGLKTGG